MDPRDLNFFKGRTVLVTGATGGLGLQLVHTFSRFGCTVYAAARTPGRLREQGLPSTVVPISMDLADPASIDASIPRLRDTSIVINNAGVNRADSVLFCRDEHAAREEMEVNYFGPLRLARALAPFMRERQEGLFVNVLSVLSIDHLVACGSYSVSKAAAHSLTEGMREELRPSNVRVIGVYPGPMDTPMSAGLPVAKVSPHDVANMIVEAILSGEDELFPGPEARDLRARWKGDGACADH
ncbi:SDR family NAD(P)-dependent oxidoreductase [Paraburkholderia pallida]|uniref:SDR family NAD(P)-dependent oxidoreductase n=1 Tax=Paraburkholderia pallida TaxID=2547399 RepID=A0A4P7CU73_9BURK|nr:SDR family NAD(P)-dependent oxidoreductase [Paraburkholderia pallida]QBQ99600.1 SDR family NAD(P)-dependent oxidoreductase [Paraburkholderia pallida]